MYCPQCQAEYRDGFTHCSDCDVDLVESLADTDSVAGDDPSEAGQQEVWRGKNQGQCVSLCRHLEEVQIPFNVAEPQREFFTGQEQGFAISVPANLYPHAKEIIDRSVLDFSDDAAEQESMEIPAEDGPDDFEQRSESWDPRNWHPEDATEEVWSEPAPVRTWMVEACLRENRIYARTDVLGDGSRKVFVMPDDESRAREIVHEIVDGIPPK